MKKLLGSTLALAMFMPAGANAELLKNFKVNGQIDLQTTSARNVADFTTRDVPAGTAAPANGNAVNNDRLGHALMRVMLSGMWDILDDVHGKVTLTKGAANNTARVWGAANENLNTVQTNVFVDEAYVKIDKLFGGLDTTFGRQFYGEPGDLIIYYGPKDNYGLNVTAIDAARADWSNEHMNLTVLAGRTTDVDDVTRGNASVDVRGIVLGCTKDEHVKPTVYLYNRLTHATGGLGATNNGGAGAFTNGKNDNLYVLGAKAKLMWGALMGHLEFAKNFGEDRTTSASQPGSYKGWALLGKAAYNMDVPNVAMVKPWGEFGMGTGDSNYTFSGNRTFQSIATDYRPGGIYGRFDQTSVVNLGAGLTSPAGVAAAQPGSSTNPASNGLSNRVIWGLGVKATPSALSKLTGGVAYWRYAFASVPPGLLQNTNAAGKPSRNIGSEIDVTAEWKHSENVSLKATAGTFQPGAYIKDVHANVNGAAPFGTNPATMLAGDVTIKF